MRTFRESANRYKLQKIIVTKGRIGPDRGRMNFIRKINGGENVQVCCLLNLAFHLHCTRLV